jgi:hypothetical protein
VPRPRYDLLVLLKGGAGSPPVFIIHGVGGNVIDILPTARRMAYPGAVIGIRARGLARGEVPHASVEAMAADYLKEIKARQPNGPIAYAAIPSVDSWPSRLRGGFRNRAMKSPSSASSIR